MQNAKVQQEISTIPWTALSEKLRGEQHTARVIESQLSKLHSGGRHVHIPLVFDDGIEWLARMDSAPCDRRSQSIERTFVSTEIETLRWLRREGFIVPEVFGEYDCQSHEARLFIQEPN